MTSYLFPKKGDRREKEKMEIVSKPLKLNLDLVRCQRNDSTESKFYKKQNSQSFQRGLPHKHLQDFHFFTSRHKALNFGNSS